MELRQLRYFVAIAKHGSFSKAAEQVFVAQSALSHQLAQLEAELGTRLLHRSRRGVELSESGRIFLAHATAILRQVDDAIASVRNNADDPSGKVVFGVPHSASNALALPLLQAVRQHLPKVELELTEELTGNLVQQLRSGQINLALLFDDGSIAEFACEYLLDEALALISPASAADRPQAAVSLQQALLLPLILPANPHGVRPIIEAAARAHGLAGPNVIADISSVSILRTTLLAGLGHTLLPVMPLQHELAAGTLCAVPVDNPTLTRRLALCASKHIPLSAAATAVARLTPDLTKNLCTTNAWLGAALIPKAP
ncbi:LysR family transcriptional regulator [Candidatus Accumulibacter phosphatis]|jgi:LysR family nitrogen assimilation transcriptional regulator|uniref:LysR family transcriptional regulator n=1 Tax=Candidatus Accumulibacter phosphatis TaxID=327160 RepID=A0ABX1TUW5_9PROT|nr:LysR substrate-binding domain-containing protein [Candidatus Accumulibacter phosphatis]NMQ27238.1 LysR family transcriptional regulator [Candidatus Accumulibacter phosphatis]